MKTPEDATVTALKHRSHRKKWTTSRPVTLRIGHAQLRPAQRHVSSTYFVLIGYRHSKLGQTRNFSSPFANSSSCDMNASTGLRVFAKLSSSVQFMWCERGLMALTTCIDAVLAVVNIIVISDVIIVVAMVTADAGDAMLMTHARWPTISLCKQRYYSWFTYLFSCLSDPTTSHLSTPRCGVYA